MAGKPIATIGSMHVCPMVSGLVPHVGGPIVGPGAPNVLINGKPAALMGDMCVCVGPPDVVAQGNPAVLINGVPVVCQGDLTAHGGVVMSGEANILISTATPSPQATLPISKIPFPEIRLFERIGAALHSDTVDLKEAKGNIEAIKRGDAEVERKIFNVRFLNEDGQKITSENIRNNVKVAASVSGINDGEIVTFKLKRKTKDGDTVVELSGTVQDKQVIIDWEVDENHFKEETNV
ncbi:hypothetical protein BZG02_11870 [Labilibaculum filiforme]|uniref:Uncharacterized protein n=1 Tax=Labilibaculum filiforme TaxID=1940526 RepID=A0A2N3HXV5_9BACT|nr:PAAR domain-containing protein [Labilibaculum filiforme]PKQ62884.1 hypothetical protein BZG02_11870 [Labilibaculum filiforme]